MQLLVEKKKENLAFNVLYPKKYRKAVLLEPRGSNMEALVLPEYNVGTPEVRWVTIHVWAIRVEVP